MQQRPDSIHKSRRYSRRPRERFILCCAKGLFFLLMCHWQSSGRFDTRLRRNYLFRSIIRGVINRCWTTFRVAGHWWHEKKKCRFIHMKRKKEKKPETQRMELTLYSSHKLTFDLRLSSPGLSFYWLNIPQLLAFSSECYRKKKKFGTGQFNDFLFNSSCGANYTSRSIADGVFTLKLQRPVDCWASLQLIKLTLVFIVHASVRRPYDVASSV